MRICILILGFKGLKAYLLNKQVSRHATRYQNCSLRPPKSGPGQAKYDSCLPKGQAGIQVFFKP